MTTLRDILGADDQPWMSDTRRNCQPPTDAPRDIQHHADLWHPSETRESYATRLCGGCPVLAQCRTWAIQQSDLLGVVGGLTTTQRARHRAKVRKVRAA